MHTKSNSDYLQPSSLANPASSHLYPFPPTPYTVYDYIFQWYYF